MNRLTQIGTSLLFALALSACDSSTETADGELAMTVHKSPTCECCDDWIDHMHDNGFSTQPDHPENMLAVKNELGIGMEYASCHTGVTESGYVFEGHVPAKLVRQFLNDPPEGSLGLAVPRMPIGSPGMEIEGRSFEPYDVLLLKKDGSSEVYAHMGSYSEQF